MFLLASFVFSEVFLEEQLENPDLYKCVVSHLFENDLLDNRFEFYSKPPDNCDFLVKNFTDHVYLDLKKNFEGDTDFDDHSSCLQVDLRALEVHELHMIRYYHENKKIGELKREKAMNEVETRIQQRIELAQESCAPEHMFSIWFDELVGKEYLNKSELELELEDLQEDYCQLSILIEKNLINATYVDHVNVNPQSIETENLDCQTIWLETTYSYNFGMKTKFEEALNHPTKKELWCIYRKIKNSHYAETMLKTWALGKIKLTRRQRKFERESMISFMKKLYNDIFDGCAIYSYM